MCGIVGVMSSYLSDPEKDRFKELMVVSNLRGWQGAGVIVADQKAQTDVFKTVGTGVDMAHDPAFNKRIFDRNHSSSVMIGHTRWPTKGAVTLEATHPHEADGIVGVHNGTIDSIFGKYVTKDESDSKLLYEAIAEYGVEETISNTTGAYALVWIDQKEQTLNFLRNDKRPLYYAVAANGNTMYWASESSMLRFILGRQAGKFEILTLLPDKWSSYPLPLKFKLEETPQNVVDVKSKPAPAVAGFGSFFPERATYTKAAQTTSQRAVNGIANPETTVFPDTGSKTPSGTTPTIPLLPPPVSTPKKQWCPVSNQWVDTPQALIRAQKTISLGGTNKDSKKPETKSSEVKESQSTEDPFRDGAAGPSRGDDGPVYTDQEVADLDDGQMVTERDFDALFARGDAGVHYAGYRETTPNTFVPEEEYVKYLAEGCMWCGDPTGDLASNQWIEADNFVCVTCAQDDYAVMYINGSVKPKQAVKQVAA